MDVSTMATLEGTLKGNCPKETRRHWDRGSRWTSGMPPRVALLIAAIIQLTGLLGCGVLPQAYFHEDEYGRYYDTKSGQVLWVTPDGIITDVSFLRHTLYDRARPSLGTAAEPSWIDRDSQIVLHTPERLGNALWTDGDWDLSDYDTVPESGMCRPPSAMTPWPLDTPVNQYRRALENKRRSCLLLIWKTPIAVTKSGFLYGVLLADSAVHLPLAQVSTVVQTLLPD